MLKHMIDSCSNNSNTFDGLIAVFDVSQGILCKRV